MVVPTISSVTPNEGLSIGETLIRIVGTNFNNEASGGTVNVLIGGVQAEEIQLINSTLIHCLSPGGEVGSVDVVVQNLTGDPVVVESVTEANGFTYKRPDLQTLADLSNYSILTLITRKLIKEFRRTIIENVHHDMHPEYSDSGSAALGVEKQAKAPHIKILGPNITRDSDYPVNRQQAVEKANDLYDIYTDPIVVKLRYTFECVGRSTGEADNLLVSTLRYLSRKPQLQVFANGVDDTDGIFEYDLDTIGDDLGDSTSDAGNDGVYKIRGSFVVRGVTLLTDIISEGHKTLTDVELETYGL